MPKEKNLMHIHIYIGIYTGSHGALQRTFNNFSEQWLGGNKAEQASLAGSSCADQWSGFHLLGCP